MAGVHRRTDQMTIGKPLIHSTSLRPEAEKVYTGILAMPTGEEPYVEPGTIRRCRRQLRRVKTFGFTPNRHVADDHSRPEKQYSEDQALPLRLFIIQGLIYGLSTILLVVAAVGIGWHW